MTDAPVTVDESATIADAARLMRDRDIGDVIVVSETGITGIVTDRDIIVRAVAEGKDTATPVSSVVSRDLQTLRGDDSVAAATTLMREYDVRRVPIVEDGELIGMVVLGDLAENQDPKSVLADISAAPPNN
jgi:CBS domain-containing protein